MVTKYPISSNFRVSHIRAKREIIINRIIPSEIDKNDISFNDKKI